MWIGLPVFGTSHNFWQNVYCTWRTNGRTLSVRGTYWPWTRRVLALESKVQVGVSPVSEPSDIHTHTHILDTYILKSKSKNIVFLFLIFFLHSGVYVFFVSLRLCSSHLLLLSASTYSTVCVCLLLLSLVPSTLSRNSNIVYWCLFV